MYIRRAIWIVQNENGQCSFLLVHSFTGYLCICTKFGELGETERKKKKKKRQNGPYMQSNLDTYKSAHLNCNKMRKPNYQ